MKAVDLNIYSRGLLAYNINPRLLTQQKAWKNLEKIKEVHQLKEIFHQMIKETDDAETLLFLSRNLTECEFELQRLWRFTPDARYHRFWFTPKCSCPKWDNEDAYPTGYYVTNSNCMLHGHCVED